MTAAFLDGRFDGNLGGCFGGCFGGGFGGCFGCCFDGCFDDFFCGGAVGAVAGLDLFFFAAGAAVQQSLPRLREAPALDASAARAGAVLTWVLAATPEDVDLEAGARRALRAAGIIARPGTDRADTGRHESGPT